MITSPAALSVAAAVVLNASAAAADLQIRPLSFQSGDVALSGTLYLPGDAAPGAPLPTVIVTGAWTSVQQQMPAVYAREMAARGFAAFTFDFRGWGGSGDLPGGVRYREDPAAKTADIKAAARFVATLPAVDPSRISGLGICASAGYMIDAAAGDPLLQSVGLVAPWLQNAALVEAVYGGPDGVAGLIAAGRAAAARGGDIIPAAGPEGAEGVLMPIGGYYYDASRGAIPAYDNRWDIASWEGWLTYHPADRGGALDKPLAIVHSEAAAIPQGVRAFLESYVGDATLRMLDDVSQFDFYDNPDDVTRAADVVAAHFRRARR